MAVIRLRCALIKIPTCEPITAIASSASAFKPTFGVRAKCMSIACIRLGCTFINIGTFDTITRVSFRANAFKATFSIGTACIDVAVRGHLRALINIFANGRTTHLIETSEGTTPAATTIIRGTLVNVLLTILSFKALSALTAVPINAV